MTAMRAARLHSPGVVRVEDVPLPRLGSGEVLVRVEHVGICGTDVSLYKGHRPVNYPLTLGHEAVGRIAAAGDGIVPAMAGTRVVLEPNFPCSTCQWCRRGRGSICPQKRALGVNVEGAFADYVAVPVAHAWPVPETVPYEDLVLVEPLAVAVHALAVSGLMPGDTAVVLGCGAIGLLLTMLLGAVRIPATVLDFNERRLEAARRLGATEALLMEGGAADTVRTRLAESTDAPVVFECSGSAGGTAWCLQTVPRGGRVVLVGMAAEDVALQPLRFVREGISLVGSMIYDHPDDFRRALNLVVGGLRAGHLVEQEFPLQEIQAGLEAASSGQVIKAVVRID